LTLASGDASFRRYFRLQKGNKSFIVMDAPPDHEDCLPFIRVAGYLEALGLNAPRVLEVDLAQGFLMLTDLGSIQYLDRLVDDDSSAEQLYADAMVALQTMQTGGAAYQASLPAFDREFLEFELSLFHDWLCETHLQISFSDDDENNWHALSELLIDSALDQPQVFVHRDYHSRNLMVTDEMNPGILDFQDAMEGPLTYDLVSLLKDCYIKWPADRVLDWAKHYHATIDTAGYGVLERDDFLRYFELMGVQRHLKAAGIFARLNHRDGKPDYLLDVPRTLSYVIDLVPRYEELAFLGRLIEERCLPGLEAGT
jgi:aminoglycoside/choline kinase family phosphotransferase